ncbi:WD40/YVTN repeat-like containing protein [Gracilaria domingensis]|nr:WD40/YVTN repeat-like containing protein [Gracilaria domingensis]
MNAAHEAVSVAHTISLALSSAGKRYREGKRISSALSALQRECQELRYDIAVNSTELSAFGYAHRVTAWTNELEAAEDYLHKVTEKATSAEVRGRVRKRLQRTAMAMRAERSKEDLDHVIEIISGVRQAFSGTVAEIERRMTLSSSSSIQLDLQFEQHFARPALPNHRLATLENREGKLRQLLVAGSDDPSFAPVYCVQGPGGMGKTVALKLMCRDEQVRNRYVDGVHWLSVGEQARDRDIISEIGRCAADAGHTELEVFLRNEERVQKAVSALSKIFKGKTVLFVLDDVWSDRKTLIRSFRELIEGGLSSTLLISTREETIGDKECHKTLKFNFLGVQSDVSREILMSSLNEQQRADLEDWIRADERCEGYLEQALSECGGWILCLSIAGAVLKEMVKDCVDHEDAVEALSTWVHELCEEIDISKQAAPMYDNSLCKVVSQSLKRCSESIEWRSDSSETVEEQFWKLGVAKKGTLIPCSVVSGLWGMNGDNDRKNALRVMKAFQDMSLLDIIRGEDRQKYLRVHDRIIDVCRSEAGEELANYHRQLLRSFLDESQAIQWSSTVPYRPWWISSIQNSYILQNVCYHLRNGHLTEELWCVVTDARWVLRWLGDRCSWQCIRDVLDRSIYEGTNISVQNIEGLHRVYRALGECWVEMKSHRSTFGFNLFARLTPEGSQSEYRFLKSIEEFEVMPWLQPLQPFERKRDNRETESFRFPGTGGFRGRFISRDLRLICGPRQIQNGTTTTRGVWSILDIYRQEFIKDVYIPRLWLQATVLTVSSDGFGTVSSYDDKLFLANGKSHTLLAVTLVGNESVALCADFSCDTTLIVGFEDCTLKVIQYGDITNGIQLHTEEGEDRIRASNVQNDHTARESTHGEACNVDVVEVPETSVCVLKGHKAIINCVAWNADGTKAASGSDDQTVRVWEVTGREGREVLVLTGHDGDVSCVAWSPDGKRIASGAFDRTMRIWDVACAHGELLLTLTGHNSNVRHAAWSPDGMRVVSGSDDRTIRVWNVNGTENNLTHVLTGHASGIRFLRFSADGNRMASTSWDQTVKFWNVHPECISTWDNTSMDEDGGSSLTYSGNGKFLASLSGSGSVRIWQVNGDMGTKEKKTIGPSEIRCVAIDREGKRLASGMWDGTLRVWDLTKENPRSLFSGVCSRDPVNCVTLSADGSHAGAACFSKCIRLWDVEAGQQSVARTLNGPGYQIEALGLSLDMQWLVVCTSPCWNEPVTIWYARNKGHRLKWRRIVQLSFEDHQVQLAIGSEMRRLPLPGTTLISYRRRHESVEIVQEGEPDLLRVTYADMVVIVFREAPSSSSSSPEVDIRLCEKDYASDEGIGDGIGENVECAVDVNDVISIQTPWVVDHDRAVLRSNDNFITLGQFEVAKCHTSLWRKGLTAHGMRDGRIVVCQLKLPNSECNRSGFEKTDLSKMSEIGVEYRAIKLFVELILWLQHLVCQLFFKATRRGLKAESS